MRPVPTDSTLKARARLFLRSEQALGQTALPLRPRHFQKSSIKTKPILPSSSPPTPPSPSRNQSLDIFISPELNPHDLPTLSRDQKTRLLAELEEQRVPGPAKLIETYPRLAESVEPDDQEAQGSLFQ